MIESLPRTQAHREVDLEVVDADKEELYSKQIPGLVKASLNRKQGGVIEEGLNLWPSIHIDGVETLYTSVFDAARKGLGDTGHECEGYDLGENGEHQKILEPTAFMDEELQDHFGGHTIKSPWASLKPEIKVMVER
ncbi:uncharacterized protein BJ212DRAFT_1504014 [Suillus subaureus]|uniref:Uncharacterized protein n=1 Tax=Suillus subaureus TaxID=48587 RepID=A0A9P7DMW3_9AGAM|nr:uncharacterized protein BJ212DRAFT_1504014 [Suillus subaureus]KAG1798719.1 hypothetical protein BJ212DRAFT_1504014 [Suillus subaureus]